MIHWYYQMYSQELLSSLSSKNRKHKNTQKPKSMPKFLFTTILQFDGITGLNLQYSQNKTINPKIDHLAEYFKSTWSKRSASPFVLTEMLYGDINRFKLTRHMKYINPQTFGIWVNKHSADMMKKETCEDAFKLYEDFKLRNRFELLSYLHKPLSRKSGFNEMIRRTHSLTAESIYNKPANAILHLEDFNKLMNNSAFKPK